VSGDKLLRVLSTDFSGWWLLANWFFWNISIIFIFVRVFFCSYFLMISFL
jgi:hypothetical protein